MKIVNKLGILTAVLSMLLITAADLSAQTRKRPVVKRGAVAKKAKPVARLYTVSSGKRIRVRINETISSKTARVGDTFTATVTEPVYSNTGVVVIPVGSEVIGRVGRVTAARKGGNPGQIDASFTSVRMPNGTSRRINGSLSDLTSDDAKSDNEGTASGDRMKNRKLIWYGGGAAGGAILGAAVGGGRGALIGALLGAGGGFLGERYTKGEEAEVRSGTEFGIVLNQAISLPRFAEANP